MTVATECVGSSNKFELPTVVQENKQFGCNTICGFEGTFPSYGPVAQLVRASPCHGEGRRFESDLGRFILMIKLGILAQLGEHLPYKQRVTGSSPVGPIY